MPTFTPYLEERQCRCGCGRSFKVLSTSSSYYFSVTHDPNYKPQPIDNTLLMKVKRASKKLYGDDMTLTDKEDEDLE